MPFILRLTWNTIANIINLEETIIPFKQMRTTLQDLKGWHDSATNARTLASHTSPKN